VSVAGRVPPAGFPVRLADALAAFGTGRGDRDEAELAAAIERRVGAGRVVLFSSGRAALVVLLRILRERAAAERTTLLVPAFGCPSLLAAAFVAGVRVRCVDVEPGTLRLDPRDLAREEGGDVLALLGVHLLGQPERMAELALWAGAHGAALIDDAAQGLGGASGGGALGSAGDAGLLSFGRGKPLALLGGGALVARGEISRAAERAAASLPRGDSALSVGASTAGYALFRRPRLFAAAVRLPGLEVGVTRYDPEIAVARIGGARARLGLRLLPRLDAARGARRLRWEAIANALAERGAGALTAIDRGAEPAYLRFPFVAPTAAARDGIIASLRRAGIGAARFYPEPLSLLAQRNGLASGRARPMPGAEALAERLVTIPVHEGLPIRAIDEIADRVSACLTGAAGETARRPAESASRAGARR